MGISSKPGKMKPAGWTYQKEKKAKEDKKCSACAGSGRYDHNGSPPCVACDGTGMALSN